MWDPLADAMLAERPYCYTLLAPRASAVGMGAGNLPVPITVLAPATVAQNVTRGPSLAMGSLADSARFNGTNAAYGRSDNSTFSSHAGASGRLAIACLIHLRGYGGAAGSWFVAKQGTGAAEFAMGVNSTGNPFVFIFTAAAATVMSVSSTKVLALNRTYMFGFEYDRALPRISLVVNGAEEVSTTASSTSVDTTSSLSIGQRVDGTRWLDGDMSHLGFYNRRLGAGVWQRWTDLALRGRTESPYTAA